MSNTWRDDILKSQRQREWWAFYAGICIAVAVMGFGALWFVMATGGFYEACL